MAENSEKTAGKRGKPFEPGKSGNPGGRPKLTDQQKDALEAIKELSPIAVSVLREVMNNKKAPVMARIKAAEVVLDRAYGKPNTQVEIKKPVDLSALDRAFEDAFDNFK